MESRRWRHGDLSHNRRQSSQPQIGASIGKTIMRKTKSAILEIVHDTATGLQKAGVMDQLTLREFDRLCLPPVMTPVYPDRDRTPRRCRVPSATRE